MTKDTGLAERMDESQEYFGTRMTYLAGRDRVWTAVAKYLQRRCCANRNWHRALPTRRFVTDRSRTTLVDQARSFD